MAVSKLTNHLDIALSYDSFKIETYKLSQIQRENFEKNIGQQCLECGKIVKLTVAVTILTYDALCPPFQVGYWCPQIRSKNTYFEEVENIEDCSAALIKIFFEKSIDGFLWKTSGKSPELIKKMLDKCLSEKIIKDIIE